MAGIEQANAAVVITTYNHAHYLAAAIESVLAQSVKPAEIVVVDDGSTDQPERITLAYRDVRIVRQENAGLSAARNRGIRETSAPYLLFLDADDRLLPRAIETGVASLGQDPSAAFTYGAHLIVQEASGAVIDITFQSVPKEAFANFLRHNPIGMHGTVMYRRGALEQAGGFGEALRACEDYDLYLRLARDHPVLCHDDVCAEYWHHGANMSRDPVFMLDSALGVLRKFRGEAEKRGLMADYRAGVADWQGFYVRVWLGLLRRSPRSALLDGPALLLRAPTAMACQSFRRLFPKRG